MPSFKSAYLIHGDDHGRIAERRRRLRALAEQESGTQGIEVFEGDAATPEAVANALNALTFALGRRFIIVDGAERWTDKQFDPLESALKDIPPDTTVAFFAREDSRNKAPEAPARGGQEGRWRHQRRGEREAVGAAQVGDRPRQGARPSDSSPTRPARSSPTSAIASSGCSASSRSSRCMPARVRASTPRWSTS